MRRSTLSACSFIGFPVGLVGLSARRFVCLCGSDRGSLFKWDCEIFGLSHVIGIEMWVNCNLVRWLYPNGLHSIDVYQLYWVCIFCRAWGFGSCFGWLNRCKSILADTLSTPLRELESKMTEAESLDASAKARLIVEPESVTSRPISSRLKMESSGKWRCRGVRPS
jgi:hypothetical protein